MFNDNILPVDSSIILINKMHINTAASFETCLELRTYPSAFTHEIEYYGAKN